MLKIDPENENMDVITEIERELRYLCTIVKQKGREMLVEFEITPPQFQALLYLVKEEDLTIGELSKRMYLACSTITDLVDRMEKNKMVKRVRDEKDRRVVRVAVLEKGHKIIQKVLTARREYLRDILKDLSEEQQTFILNGISMVYERTDAMK
ncbi:MarR family winged helix-turn-helix transcriptional regulator [Isachenkonia alkalipeptolytica]|uniref:MarR family transcriptional regulator n=1 Tax=Isachenkonia alkalipeptolytica TaxID=2565777 RepID=A0AA43XKH4_9CLOT|nr:MarR family transcriptional regulator [Isachenkonia alkalipeptolytica]NBG87909.1 MarR family transcriptional regulator [Isachenkonia alkalipeptolytica]